MKKIIITLILLISNNLNSEFFDIFFPSESNNKDIQKNIDLNDNSSLLKLVNELSNCVKDLTEKLNKIEFKIFNINCQKGSELSNIINNENLNNLKNQNSSYQYVGDIKKYTKESFNSIIGWIKNNKIRSMLISFTSIYVTLNLNLIFLTYKLSRDNNWSNWQINKNIEEFYTIPQNIFAKDLLKDINRSYIKFDNIKDNITPISKFIIDIHKEISYLNTYKKIVDFLISAKLDKIFLYNKKIYIESEKKLNRLMYIKNIFLSWLIENKLSQLNIG